MPQHDLSLGRHFADQPAADHPRCRISSGLGRVQTRRSWVGPTGNDLSSRVRMGSEPRVGGLRLARGGEPEGGLLQSPVEDQVVVRVPVENLDPVAASIAQGQRALCDV